MRTLGLVAVATCLWACGGGTPAAPGLDASSAPARIDLPFGPYDLPATSEDTTDCVQITLHNDDALYVNAVELTTGPGFHHSNWFFVPEFTFAGDDGTFRCTDRGFDQAVAAIQGGVIFAQSTQDPHELQQFPAGHVVKVPAHNKLVAQIHLLNSGDDPVHLAPSIALTPIAPADVTTILAGVSFEDQALGLPPNAQSAFTLDCDLGPGYQKVLGKAPDFHIFYALAHYHSLGTALHLEALTADGTSTPIFSTEHMVGDALGGPVAPAFDMTGFTRLRVTCDYYNDRASTVLWGNGDQEMCVFLAFTDSPYNWAGGALTEDPAGAPTMVDGVATYSHACQVLSTDASH
jgi:hypothetical protein